VSPLQRSAELVVALRRAEGWSAIVARARDHLRAARRRRGFRIVTVDRLPAVPVLRVGAAPPVPWLGGVPAQLGLLMRQAERHRDTALLYPWRHVLRLEVVANGERRAALLPAAAAAGGGDQWAAAVERAAVAVGAELVHVEGAAGLPLEGLALLARRRPLVLSLHDFALFCPRPNLYDVRRGAPCGYCADAATCHATLAAAGHPDAEGAWGWRQRGSELLAACRAVVYPSEFLRAAHDRLFGSAGVVQRVIPPGIERARLDPWRWPWTARSPAPRLAFLGGGGPHKGARLLIEVIEEWTRRALPTLQWEVLGGGGPEQLRALRRLPGVRVRGYYRHGSLGGRLRAERIELALLLPQVPESFSLSLSECLAAGVPVMAVAHGALADRLAAGGGHPLPSGIDAAGVAAALADWCAGRLPQPPPPAPVPTAAEAARSYTRLFDELRGAATVATGRGPFQYPRQPGDRLRELGAAAERVAGGAGRWARREAGAAELWSAWKASRRRARHGAPPPLAGPPIVYLPALPWSYRFQRPQQLARAFVGAGHPLLYVEAFQRTRLLPRVTRASTAAGVELLRLAVPGRPDPYRQPMTADVIEQLAAAVADGVRDRPLMVLAQLPFWTPLALRLRELLAAPLVYDRIDFHLGFPGVAVEVDALEGELMAAADVVLASSRVLLAGCERAMRCALVPNAVDLDDFPPPQRRFGEPVTVGYVGALGPWFDAPSVAALATARPQWRVRLAGRVEAPAVRALGRHRNVELLGEIPYPQVPGFLAGLQALLIPFLDLPLTRAVDPVKLYEGLATGVPVVSCPLPAVEHWREPYVYRYEAGGLLPALERALAEDRPQHAAERRRAVEGQTWRARAAAVLRLVGDGG
jgi:glycosyltransferase involved in cell wall biosynthesis